MNFIAICLHCLDMRDFHSTLPRTPNLDRLKRNSIFVPFGKGQGHNQHDSLNAELTGMWSARMSTSTLTEKGFQSGDATPYPPTIMERLSDHGYEIITWMGKITDEFGTFAVPGGLSEFYMKDQPERLRQFDTVDVDTLDDWIAHVKRATRFYAHLFIRTTHRPWGQRAGLGALAGEPPCGPWPEDASYARKLALSRPDEFAALRRRGLARADELVGKIFEETRSIPNVIYLIYSNHGEVFDHFRYNQAYTTKIAQRDGPEREMIVGTSHGAFPYEVLYSNMQMWVIPNEEPRYMRGVARSIDIAPTFLELAGLPPEGMDGSSMLPSFKQGAFPPKDRYAEAPQLSCASLVRADGLKYLYTEAFPTHAPAVFDLIADPRESCNLFDTNIGQEVVEWALHTHENMAGHALPGDPG